MAFRQSILAGITPDPENPGFKHFIIKPHPVAGLDWIKAEHDSLYGKIKVAWRKTGRKANFEVRIPQHTTATVIFPDGGTEKVAAGNHQFSM